mmetsp:Transcript_155056/g.269980  ORF Transcript_155056/g.269980 Transcript_155056/m.269980 type:complete len:482 (-) Transcript_155056:58-1503(-)
MGFSVMALMAAKTFLDQDSALALLQAAPAASWGQYFSQSAYHMTIVPLLLLSCVLAFLARPSTSEIIPPGFKSFQWSYLSVWCFCVGADWLQGPYVYALYDAYGFSSAEIAQLFVAGFGSSLAFGCIVGSVTDKFGRKRCCIAYCILYILSCMTKHYKNYQMLMVGRITGGIATSMLFSCFECWLVSEHCQRHAFSGGLLSYMFGMMFSVMYAVAIAAGLVAQAAADGFKFAPIYKGSQIYSGGYCAPFDLAIGCLVVGMILIATLWEENYGSDSSDGEQESLVQSFRKACSCMMASRSMLLVGCIVACYEGSMFAFVFNWTPALESKTVPPPHGVIFALFMMACMCGASLATMVSGMMRPALRLTLVFIVGTLSFMVAALVAGKQVYTSFAAFMIFEFCCGLYFPSIGVLKSEIVPEHIRATVYNIYRVPLNGVVVVLLLTNISMVKCFTLCSSLLALALFSIVSIMASSSKSAIPEKEV